MDKDERARVSERERDGGGGYKRRDGGRELGNRLCINDNMIIDL